MKRISVTLCASLVLALVAVGTARADDMAAQGHDDYDKCPAKSWWACDDNVLIFASLPPSAGAHGGSKCVRWQRVRQNEPTWCRPMRVAMGNCEGLRRKTRTRGKPDVRVRLPPCCR